MDYLETLAQIAIGLIGFAGVIATFASRPGEWHARDRARLLVVLTASVAALFLSLAPLALRSLGVDDAATWRISSGALSASTLVISAAFYRRFRRLDQATRRGISKLIMVPLLAGSVLNGIAQAANAAGMFQRAEGVFLTGMIWSLFPPALQFARMVYVQMVEPELGDK